MPCYIADRHSKAFHCQLIVVFAVDIPGPMLNLQVSYLEESIRHLLKRNILVLKQCCNCFFAHSTKKNSLIEVRGEKLLTCVIEGEFIALLYEVVSNNAVPLNYILCHIHTPTIRIWLGKAGGNNFITRGQMKKSIAIVG